MMHRFGQGLFPIAILTLLVGLTFWLQSASEFRSPGSDGLLRHDPDFFVENFKLRRFARSGDLQSILSADRMMHYPDDDTTVVTEPRMTFFKGPRPTLLTARQGLIAPDGREVVLVDKVRGVREAAPGEPEIVFTTTHLTLLPDSDLARTHAPVTLVQGASVVRAIGMEADNKTRIIQLLNQVSSTIEKRRRPRP